MGEGVYARSWWAAVLRGILAVIFGVIVLAWPGATTLVLVILFGAFALLDGIVEIILSIVHATQRDKWGAFLIRGLIGLIIGIIVFARPGVALVVLLYAIAIWLIASGFVEIVLAIEAPAETSGSWLLGVAGALSIIIGILLMVFPDAGIWTIILLIGIYAICLGMILVVFGFSTRSYEKEIERA